MLFLRFLLIAVGVGLFGGASGVVAYDVYIAAQLRRLLCRRKSRDGGTEAGEKPFRPLSPAPWTPARQLSKLGIAAFLRGLSIVAASVAMTEVGVGQISGTRPATLCVGARPVVPLMDNAATYDLCENALSAPTEEFGKLQPATRRQQRLDRRS